MLNQHQRPRANRRLKFSCIAFPPDCSSRADSSALSSANDFADFKWNEPNAQWTGDGVISVKADPFSDALEMHSP